MNRSRTRGEFMETGPLAKLFDFLLSLLLRFRRNFLLLRPLSRLDRMNNFAPKRFVVCRELLRQNGPRELTALPAVDFVVHVLAHGFVKNFCQRVRSRYFSPLIFSGVILCNAKAIAPSIDAGGNELCGQQPFLKQ